MIDLSKRAPRISLGAAVRRFWPCLLGVGVFPFLFLASQRLFRVPIVFVFLAFLAAALPPLWACLLREAPFTFYFLALGILMGSIVLAFLLFLPLLR